MSLLKSEENQLVLPFDGPLTLVSSSAWPIQLLINLKMQYVHNTTQEKTNCCLLAASSRTSSDDTIRLSFPVSTKCLSLSILE